MASALRLTPGEKTTDYTVLEQIAANITDDIRGKLKEGILKKIVLVLTDGDSLNATRVRKVLEKLRSEGVVIVGVGITEEGKSALATYASDAKLAQAAGDISVVLADALKEHLADI